MKSPEANIEHVVVVMLENRSFDNVLAWLYEHETSEKIHFIPEGTSPVYRGLTRDTLTCYANSFYDPDDGEQKEITVLPQRGAQKNIIGGVEYANSPIADPHEKFEHVTNQLYGPFPPTVPFPFAGPAPAETPDMKGFLQDYASKIWDLKEFFSTAKERLRAVEQVMDTYTPEDLPILNGLARSFAVSDEWYSSVPSQTNPNRAFMACGTSLGEVNNRGDFDQGCFNTETIWNLLHDKGVSWKIFWETEYPPYVPYFQPKRTHQSWTEQAFPQAKSIPTPQSFPRMADFHRRARTGALPYFSFIEPAWTLEAYKFDGHDSPTHLVGVQGHECHPPGDVRPGEIFIGEIYNSLIACEETWKKTLLIITFDEHGGTFDHWPPPKGATPPDDCDQDGFPFDRFGVRVATVFVSPYVLPQTVFRSPCPDVPYDHTSIPASLIKWKELEKCKLGKRTAKAPTFEGVLHSEPVNPNTVLGTALEEVVDPGALIHFGDSFHLQYASNLPKAEFQGLVVAAADDRDLEPTLEHDLVKAVPLQFTLGLPPSADVEFELPTDQVVRHGSAVHIHTAESTSRMDGDKRDLSVDNHYSSSIGGYCYYRSARGVSDADTWSQWTVQRADLPPGSLGQPITYGSLIYLMLRNPLSVHSWLPGKLIPYSGFLHYYLILAGDSDFTAPEVGVWRITRA